MMRRALLALALAITAFIGAEAKIYVVSVGIADYEQINDLRFTEQDVDLFNEYMRFHDADITTLKGKQATHTNVINALRLVCGRATKDDTMIFYFSGHGYEGGFCCYDMRANAALGNSTLNKVQKNSLNSYAGGISYKEMQILFQNCRAGKKMVYADACFSGGLKKGNQLNLSVQSARNGDVMFFLSSLQTETSLEMSGGPNGWFTYCLVAGLLGQADKNGDNMLTVKEVFDFTSDAVINATDGRQHPEMWGRFNENMVLFKLK